MCGPWFLAIYFRRFQRSHERTHHLHQLHPCCTPSAPVPDSPTHDRYATIIHAHLRVAWAATLSLALSTRLKPDPATLGFFFPPPLRIAFGVSKSGGMKDCLIAMGVPGTSTSGFYTTSASSKSAPTKVGGGPHGTCPPTSKHHAVVTVCWLDPPPFTEPRKAPCCR